MHIKIYFFLIWLIVCFKIGVDSNSITHLLRFAIFQCLCFHWDHPISYNVLLRLATLLHRELAALLFDIKPVYVLFRCWLV